MRDVLLVLFVCASVCAVRAQEERVERMPEWAFNWRVGDWWVLTKVPVTSEPLENWEIQEARSHFYFKVADKTFCDNREAFVVAIYYGNREISERLISLREEDEGWDYDEDGGKCWPKDLEWVSPEDFKAGFPLIAKLFVSSDDYSPLRIEYSDWVKRCTPEGYIEKHQNDLKGYRLLHLYKVTLYYPSQDDPIEEYIVLPRDPKQHSDYHWCRYILLKGELWVYKQEWIDIDLANRFTTSMFVVLTESSSESKDEITILLRPSIKRENLQKRLKELTDRRSVDIFKLGSNHRLMSLDEYFRMMTTPLDPPMSLDSPFLKSKLSVFKSLTNEEIDEERKRLKWLLGQEPQETVENPIAANKTAPSSAGNRHLRNSSDIVLPRRKSPSTVHMIEEVVRKSERTEDNLHEKAVGGSSFFTTTTVIIFLLFPIAVIIFVFLIFRHHKT